MEKRCQHVLLPVSGAIPGLEGYECVFCSERFADYALAFPEVAQPRAELALQP
jgi:hypothetical protein